MGIPNFFGQESQLNGLEGDIQQIREYVAGMNGCLGELNACWSGSNDKRVAVGGIQRHLAQANSVANSINDFKDTALHVLRRINELGRVTGIGLASIGFISIVNIFDNFRFGTRINVDTGALRAVADKVAGEKRRLCDVEFSIKSTKNVIDIVVLNIFGLSRKLRNIDKEVDQLEAANDRIVSSLCQICDVYEQTEASLKQRAIEIMDVESHTDVFTAAAVTSFAVNTPKAKPGGGDGGGGSGATSGSPVVSGGKCLPVNGINRYRDDYPQYNGGGRHDGTDFAAREGVKLGDPVMAVMGGKVVQVVGNKPDNTYPNPTYGNYVIVQLPTGEKMYYAHLSSVSDIKVGQTIDAGTQIGQVGNSGCSTGAHLHFEVRNANNKPVNPFDYLPNL